HAVLGNARHSRQERARVALVRRRMTGLKDLLRLDRARHFLVALAVAGALGAIGLFAPLDWLIWTGHSRIVERPASGETVFVAAAEDLSEPTKPERRLSLSTLIDELSKAGAERIFLDVRFAQPSALAADEALKRS